MSLGKVLKNPGILESVQCLLKHTNGKKKIYLPNTSPCHFLLCYKDVLINCIIRELCMCVLTRVKTAAVEGPSKSNKLK